MFDVVVPPEFHDEWEEIKILEGSTVTLSCESEGDPPIETQWNKEGVNLQLHHR